MRSLHILLSRLVRTHGALQPPSFCTRHPSLVRALHDFGDPDTFGDLKKPLEKPRQKDSVEDSEPSFGADLHDKDNDGKHSLRNAKGSQHRHKAVPQRIQDDMEVLKWNSAHTGHHQSLARSERNNLSSAARETWPSTDIHSSRGRDTRGEAQDARRLERQSDLPSGPQTNPAIPSADGDDVSAASGGIIDWELEPDDADDVAADRLRQVVSQVPQLGISCHAYGRKLKRMVKNGKLREALELFNNQMLLVDKLQPDAYCYNILISGCAQAGYAKMAFKLYRDMRRRHLKPKHVTYTALLNACANGPSPADGLRRIEQLTTAMADRGYAMNPINYQALIKAYGRCGELQRAFETADELLRLGHPLTAELASFLLQACISDTGEGFRHALLVWHKVRSKHVPPSIYLYNLMLRAALDCGAGDIATFEQAMKLIVSSSPPEGAAVAAVTAGAKSASGSNRANPGSSNLGDENRTMNARPKSSTKLSDSTQSSPQQEQHQQQKQDTQVVHVTECLRSAGALEKIGPLAADLPDLLGPRPHRGGLVELRHLDTAPARLAVLGGWTGLLQTMAADGVQPDIRTFSLLLNTMPNDSGQQESLLKTMDALGVQPDVGFFNQLIKKRASYRDTAGAKAAFGELERRQLTPDVASFGCLAMSVSSQRGLQEFMEKLEAANVRPNVEILTTLLNGSARAADPHRTLAVMEAFVTHQVRPDRRALQRLEELRLRLQELLVERERGGPVPSAARRRSFPEWVQKFRLRYAGWLAETEMEPELPQSSQYRPRSLIETVEDGKRVTAGGT
ncbi:pentatricopeptide repeat-containing protein 1, mitochondrial-like [Amphibalanus amphitrite]|uniref:pentatricopeptide repeat-containing protein 1, mitochondrial-like n=1 Tax=Amphibalanus amphitrite TaxID=1232801 RepID=UPI001C91C089|nr:pentatricopeptide repeat-containing protein 1, mitochondrial-like [Amphibalanus amphitrite]XP_043196083.1 pentatricopeptide repeat-containing protein 1, mitochondrial-like [Amphibalanus amphitrite]XP_043196084.1 pentatricopeptide repeat-containing protein 1, mitochondrial-like [Amphibalanus amphitrite]